MSSAKSIQAHRNQNRRSDTHESNNNNNGNNNNNNKSKPNRSCTNEEWICRERKKNTCRTLNALTRERWRKKNLPIHTLFFCLLNRMLCVSLSFYMKISLAAISFATVVCGLFQFSRLTFRIRNDFFFCV